MKILVIGGTRYFGKRLVHLLLERGHEVWILSRGQVPLDQWLKPLLRNLQSVLSKE